MNAYLDFPTLNQVLGSDSVCDQYDAFRIWKESHCPTHVKHIENTLRDLINGTNKIPGGQKRFREIVRNVNEAADALAQKMNLDTNAATYEDIHRYYTSIDGPGGLETLADVQSYLKEQVKQSKLGDETECWEPMNTAWVFCEGVPGIQCAKNCGARALVTINQLIISFLWQLGLWKPYSGRQYDRLPDTLIDLLDTSLSQEDYVPWNWAQMTLLISDEKSRKDFVTSWGLDDKWEENKEKFSPGYTRIKQLRRATFRPPRVRLHPKSNACVSPDCRDDPNPMACRIELFRIQELLQTIIGPDLIGNVYRNKQQWMFDSLEDIEGLDRFSRSVMFLFVVLLPFINVGYVQKQRDKDGNPEIVQFDLCNKHVRCPEPPIKPTTEYVCGVSDKDVHPVFLIPFKEFYASNEQNKSIINLLPSLKDINEQFLETNGLANVFFKVANK